MTPSQGDVVLVPVPFTDLAASKRRPVMVLSSTSHNRKSRDVIVAAITSNLASGGRPVRVSSADFQQGHLPTDSLVRAVKVYTLSKDIIVRRFGRLTPAALQRVLAELDTVLGR